MTHEDPPPPAGAVRLGQLLRRATSRASHPSLPGAHQWTFRKALAGRRRFGGWWWAAVGVTAAAAAIAISTLRTARTLTFEMDGVGAAAPGAALEQRELGSGRVRFSDGSTLVLERGARARVLGVDARGARLAVERGDVGVSIRHRDGARWLVAAGPFEIVVTGTAFDVRWTDDQRLRVRLREGTVIVRGSLAGAGLEVRAGQTFTARLTDGEVHLGSREDERAQAEDVAEAVPGSAPVPAPARASALALGSASRREGSAPRARASDWNGRLADTRGIEDCLARCDDEGLDELARTARHSGLPDVARRALRTLRARRPGSELAHDAAFVLGRLAEDAGDPAEALSFYDAYLDEREPGPYRPYALGRKMALVERLEGLQAARRLADTYLRRYPQGAHSAHARQVLSGP